MDITLLQYQVPFSTSARKNMDFELRRTGRDHTVHDFNDVSLLVYFSWDTDFLWHDKGCPTTTWLDSNELDDDLLFRRTIHCQVIRTSLRSRREHVRDTRWRGVLYENDRLDVVWETFGMDSNAVRSLSLSEDIDTEIQSYWLVERSFRLIVQRRKWFFEFSSPNLSFFLWINPTSGANWSSSSRLRDSLKLVRFSSLSLCGSCVVEMCAFLLSIGALRIDHKRKSIEKSCTVTSGRIIQLLIFFVTMIGVRKIEIKKSSDKSVWRAEVLAPMWNHVYNFRFHQIAVNEANLKYRYMRWTSSMTFTWRKDFLESVRSSWGLRRRTTSRVRRRNSSYLFWIFPCFTNMFWELICRFYLDSMLIDRAGFVVTIIIHVTRVSDHTNQYQFSHSYLCSKEFCCR